MGVKMSVLDGKNLRRYLCFLRRLLVFHMVQEM